MRLVLLLALAAVAGAPVGGVSPLLEAFLQRHGGSCHVKERNKKHASNLLAEEATLEARGVTIEGADDAYDFGSGAGFYVDATNYPWSQYYNMYDLGVPRCCGAFTPSTRLVSIRRGRGWFLFRV